MVSYPPKKHHFGNLTFGAREELPPSACENLPRHSVAEFLAHGYGDDGSSCLTLGRDRVRSAAGGFILTRE
jgi:hypothetical protein